MQTGNKQCEKCSRLGGDLSNTRPLRVLYLSPGGAAGRGGMGRMAHYIMGSFAKNPSGVQCKVIDTYGPGATALMPIFFLIATCRIVAACLFRRVDVVHLNMAHGGSSLRKLGLLKLAALFGVPAVLHLHGSKFEVFSERLSPAARSLMIKAMNQAVVIIVIGSYWRRYLETSLGIDPNKIQIVHNGVPSPDTVPEQDVSSLPLIVSLGLLGERKGTFDLVAALALENLAVLKWHAVIAGNGDVEGIRREADNLRITPRVELPGWLEVESARALLRRATIFVLPSHNEGLPVSILEAMAMRLPVVATPVGAIPDAIVSGKTGLLVPVGDPGALAVAIEKLLRDPHLREELGRNAKERFLAQFTIDATAERLITIYRETSRRKLSDFIEEKSYLQG